MKRLAFLLSLGLLALSSPGIAQDDDFAEFLVRGNATEVEAVAKTIEELFADSVATGLIWLEKENNRCNGGTCFVAGTNPPVILSCPTSGGPICKDGEKCSCVCDSTGTSTNKCT